MGSRPIEPFLGWERYLSRNKEMRPENDMELQLWAMTYKLQDVYSSNSTRQDNSKLFTVNISMLLQTLRMALTK